MNHSVFGSTLFASAVLAGLLVMSPVAAQYKYVGPDGRVTYSDQPPPSGQKVVDEKRLGRTASPTVALPFGVQQAVTKFPVTLITGEKCVPCDDGRTYLRNRGVPFTEKTVTSDEDIAAFKQQSPDGTAPVLAVGSRKAVGFAQTTWSSLLDDAGYPSTSALPPDYQNPVASALSPATRAPAAGVGTAAQAPTAAAAKASPAPRRGAGVPGAVTSAEFAPPPANNVPAANPAGIKF